MEFALISAPFLTMLFGFVATNTVFTVLSSMQNNAQYAARLLASGQVKNLVTGVVSATNLTSTTKCTPTLSSTTVEYYACQQLPSWGSFVVTVTQNCATPSVTVALSVSGATAALGDIYRVFSGKTIGAQAVLMKEGQCP